jgi:broad specificity phosphatase PhoE
MKPDNIFVVRHGQSQGNVDREIYKTIPDYAVQLTDKGMGQAVEAGKQISSIIGDSTIQFYVSPFWRTRQTYLGIRESFPSLERCKYYEDPRLREQEWTQLFESRMGYADVENERDGYGHFYYRFKNGESCADVYDRMSDFMGTMFRDFEKNDFPRNVVIVTHGMTMRLFLMRWFHTSVEEFESWGNPWNGTFFHLARQDYEPSKHKYEKIFSPKYKLLTPLKLHELKHNWQFPFNDNKFLTFPHVLPYVKKD